MNNPTTFKQSFIEDCSESEILLCAGRTRMDAKNAARIEALLESNLNWKRVLQLAEQHGLMPPLYKHLKTISPKAVPPLQMQRLHDYFYRNAARNLLLEKELQKLLELFRSNQIPALSYKGAVLTKIAYGDGFGAKVSFDAKVAWLMQK